jgi:hypothetical protein
MNHDIMCLTKWPYKPEFKFSYFYVSYLPSLILYVIRLKFFYVNNVYE